MNGNFPFNFGFGGTFGGPVNGRGCSSEVVGVDCVDKVSFWASDDTEVGGSGGGGFVGLVNGEFIPNDGSLI